MTSNTASTATPALEPVGQRWDPSGTAAYRHSYTSTEHAKPSEPAHASASGSHLAFTLSQVVVVVADKVTVVAVAAVAVVAVVVVAVGVVVLANTCL